MSVLRGRVIPLVLASVLAASPAQAGPPPPLPPHFLLGVATSGYQCEGGETDTNWNRWAATYPATVEPVGDTVDFWHRYPEDIARAARMGLNAFRLGIEWGRIEPTPGTTDTAAIEHYRRIVRVLRKHHLEPIVTLNHTTWPQWLEVMLAEHAHDLPVVLDGGRIRRSGRGLDPPPLDAETEGIEPHAGRAGDVRRIAVPEIYGVTDGLDRCRIGGRPAVPVGVRLAALALVAGSGHAEEEPRWQTQQRCGLGGRRSQETGQHHGDDAHAQHAHRGSAIAERRFARQGARRPWFLRHPPLVSL